METLLSDIQDPSTMKGIDHSPRSALVGTSTWVLKSNHSFSFGEYIRSHTDVEFAVVASVFPEELEDFADGETAFELLKGEDEEASCSLSVSTGHADCSVVGVILVCNCATIELYAPSSSGYICTSRGSLIADEDLGLYGHLVDLRLSSASQIEFRVFHRSKSAPNGIIFLGFHIFVKTVAATPVKQDRGSALPSHFFSSPSANNAVPVDLLCHKLENLRTDMTAMETRLRAHFDNQMDSLRRDIFQRLDELKPRKIGENSDSTPLPQDQ